MKTKGPTSAQVREARKAAGLTQSKAAAIIDATLRTWQEWEGGRRNMPPIKYAAFCMLTGYDTQVTNAADGGGTTVRP